MPTNDDPPEPLEAPEVHLIDTLDALKVFADPLRQRILETLSGAPRTVKQIAAELEIAPTKLYYHVNLLEEHRLIRVVDTRIVSGIIEKQYDTAADSFRIKRELLAPGQDDAVSGLDAAIDAVIEPMRRDLSRSIASGLIDLARDPEESRRLKMGRMLWRMRPERADEFYDKLSALLDEYYQDDSGDLEDDPQTGSYGLVIVFYPTTSKAPRPHRRRRD